MKDWCMKHPMLTFFIIFFALMVIDDFVGVIR